MYKKNKTNKLEQAQKKLKKVENHNLNQVSAGFFTHTFFWDVKIKYYGNGQFTKPDPNNWA